MVPGDVHAEPKEAPAAHALFVQRSPNTQSAAVTPHMVTGSSDAWSGRRQLMGCWSQGCLSCRDVIQQHRLLLRQKIWSVDGLVMVNGSLTFFYHSDLLSCRRHPLLDPPHMCCQSCKPSQQYKTLQTHSHSVHKTNVRQQTMQQDVDRIIASRQMYLFDVRIGMIAVTEG